MKFLKTNILLLSVFIALSFSKTVLSYNVETHKFINEVVAETILPNGFTLNDYLVNQLDLKNGIKEKFSNKEIKFWISDGGRFEDKPPIGMNPLSWFQFMYLRSINHFHDPIINMGYNMDGDTNMVRIVNKWSYYSFSINYIGTYLILMSVSEDTKSSLDWALSPKEDQYLGYYSWYDVMDYYYNALTLPNQTGRNDNFEDTFRGLGQLMHLIQDAASPAHTRNDQHFFYNYESWVKVERNQTIISSYVPLYFEGAVFGFDSFIDTDQYVKPDPNTDPDPNVTASKTIGLSEYTNANFYSGDTINSTSYPYPQIPEVPVLEERIFINNNNQPDEQLNRLYYKKNSDGEKGPQDNGYLLSAVDYLTYYKKQVNPRGREKVVVPLLDHNVYSEYADLLLPRAIGYSAGMLNYFFRGEIKVSILGNELTIENVCDYTIGDNSTELELYREDNLGNRTRDTSLVLKNSNEAKFGPLSTNGKAVFTFTPQYDAVRYIVVFYGIIGGGKGVVAKVVPLNTPGFPDTGQIQDFTPTFGEDSDYNFHQLSYIDNGDGTITDFNTGLMWQQWDDNIVKNWNTAVNYCSNSTLAGHIDWRLPEIKELLYIVNYGVYGTAIDQTYFPNTIPMGYWSTTTHVNTSSAWHVDFYNGFSNNNNKSDSHSARCVRGAKKSENFAVNGDGTVTDNITGLMWQREDDNMVRNWEVSITYCEGLTLAGHNDWRLPNVKELKSIANHNRLRPAINQYYFPNTNTSANSSGYYWSSTTYIYNTYSAWSLGHGGDSAAVYRGKSNGYFNRCVRGGK